MCKWSKLLPFLCLCLLAFHGLATAGEPLQMAKETSTRLRKTAVPSVEVLHSVFDFAYASGQTEISHDFHIRNLGDGTLRIEDIAPE